VTCLGGTGHSRPGLWPVFRCTHAPHWPSAILGVVPLPPLAPKCPACSYNTAGLTEPKCPECGSDCSLNAFEAVCRDRARSAVRAWGIATVLACTALALVLLTEASGERDAADFAWLPLVQFLCAGAAVAMYRWTRKHRVAIGAWTAPRRWALAATSVVVWGPGSFYFVTFLPLLIPAFLLVVLVVYVSRLASER
jgi:hypothetical protein